jgi:hypothetical protein
MGLLDFLAGPVKGLLDGAKGIIGSFVADPAQKLEAQEKLADLQATLQTALLAADAKFAELQQNVIVAETKSESVLARNWRPMLMYVFMAILVNNYLVSPLAHTAVVPVPDQMWDLLKLGVTGYIVGRSVEKAGPAIAGALKGGAS